ncbi:hypothetical protein K3495_g8705 [Podosphaera aphanis]|nr:hypothetical protein K3495_g8705 [Podosphaera aphanis]
MNQFTARYVAPLTFTINFAAQIYGITSTPNMKDIHDANLSFWSPQPVLVATFFFPHQIFQLIWLSRLWRIDAKKGPSERMEVVQLLDYAPYLSLGNLCIAIWMIFWNQSNLKMANVFVIINSLAQLYYIFGRLSPMHTRSTSSVLTHIVAKTYAGIGFLDLLHNGSIAYFDHQGPNIVVKILTGLGFSLLAGISDWIFGGCLVYNLIALSVGQRGIGETAWSNLLLGYALATAGVVGIRNYLKPPYLGYDLLASSEDDDDEVCNE